MKKKNENKQKAMLLSDDPVSEDQFAGRAHERVSRGLYSIITSNGDGGYAIGLEGTWGSGKSSVIRMLDTKLNQDKKINSILYTFDTYGHIGDPMKRSFLNRLIEFLKNQGVLCKLTKKWDDLLKEINAQIEITTIKKTPRVPCYLYLMALYLVSLPFILLSINYLSKPENTFADPERSMEIILWLLGVGIGYPIIITALTWVWREYVPWARFKGVPPVPSLRFTETQTSDKEYVKKESSDTSSIEFNKYFKEIISSIGNNKLIVVIDNLDRLEFEDVREIWGSLRNFFTSYNDENDAYAKALQKVILVVPYDKNLIIKAFNGEDLEGAGFIEKTFKTVIKVSDPILIHWKEYLLEKFRDAFKGNQIDDLTQHEIFKYFEFHFSDGTGNTLSPRSIKFLINEMVVLYYQWGEEVPLKYIALFVTNRQRIESAYIFNPEKFLPANLYNDLEMDTEWYGNLLALRYNVKIEDVRHVILSRKMVDILASGEEKEIEDIRKCNGIFDTFEKDVFDSGFQLNFKDDPDKLLRFIIGTKKFQVPAIHINKPRNVLFDLILFFTRDNKNRLHLLKSSYLAEGILSFVQLFENEKIKSQTIIVLLNAITPQEIDVKVESTDGNKKIELTTLASYWKLMAESIEFLWNCFEDKKDFKASIKDVKLPEIDSKFTLVTTYKLYACWEEYDINLFSFNHDYTIMEMLTILNNEIQQRPLYPELVEATKHLIKADQEGAISDLDSLINTISSKIKELAGGRTSNENERNLIILLNTLFAIEDILSGSTVESIKELDKTKAFHKTLRFNKIKNDKSLFPKIFYNLLIYGRISLNTTDTRRHQNLNSISRFISDLLNGKVLKEDMFNELVNLAVSNYQSVILPLPTKYPKKYPLFIEIARAMVLSGKLTNQSIEYLIKHYNNSPLMQEEEVRNKFFQCILDVKQKVIESLRITDIPISLLTDLKNENGNAFNLMVKFIKEKLRSFTSSEWESIFEGNGGELKYLEYLAGQKFLDKDFKDQLLKITKQAIQNEEFSVTDEKIISNFPKLLEKKVGREFYKQVQAELVKSYQTNTSFVSGLIDRLGKDILLPYTPVSKEYANSLIQNLIIPFIKDDQFALGWVEFNLTQVKAFYNKSSTEVKDSLKNSINRIYQKIVNRSDLEEKEELLSQINSIAKGLKIKLVESK